MEPLYIRQQPPIDVVMRLLILGKDVVKRPKHTKHASNVHALSAACEIVYGYGFGIDKSEVYQAIMNTLEEVPPPPCDSDSHEMLTQLSNWLKVAPPVLTKKLEAIPAHWPWGLQPNETKIG